MIIGHVSKAFYEMHRIHLVDARGAVHGYFTTMICAAFSAVCRGSSGVSAGLSVVDTRDGETWNPQEAYRRWLNYTTPKGTTL